MSNHQHECYRLQEPLKNINRMWILLVKRSFRFTKEQKAMLADVIFESQSWSPQTCLECEYFFFWSACSIHSFCLSLFQKEVRITFRSKAERNYRVRVVPFNVIKSCFGPLLNAGRYDSRLPETTFYYSNSFVFFVFVAFAPYSIWKAAFSSLWTLNPTVTQFDPLYQQSQPIFIHSVTTSF